MKSRFIEDITVKVLKGWIGWKSGKRLPQTDGVISLAGVNNAIEIIRDQWGVPHIYAGNLDDLAFGQGYVQAQDRLWQMEINRRVARGRLSEVAGDITLETDRATRTLGFERLAKEDFKTIDPLLERYLSDYLRGVNTFVETNAKKLPVEYSLLNFTPHPWDEIDILAFSRMLAWQLSFAWFGEIVRAKVIDQVGVEKAAELEIHYPAGNPSTLDKSGEVNIITDDGRLQAMNGPFLKPVGGSNAWAISGKHTKSGNAILCNDPHMPMAQPSLWYENHLSANGIAVTGVTLPGVPLVMIGHNENIAWGMTLAFTDIQDLYIEKFTDETCSHYEFAGEQRESTIIEETIKIKNKSDHIENVICTHHGPVISNIIGEKNLKLTLHSTALGQLNIMDGWFKLNQAKGWDDFVESMRCINAPALNVPYADKDGNIGYWVTGEVPVRKNGIIKTPTKGWEGNDEWGGMVPFEEMPHTFNPEKGYVISCNHKIIPDDYPHDMGDSWMNGYRAKRFEMMFAERGKLDFEDMKEMQTDVLCLPFFEFIEHFKSIETDDLFLTQAKEKLISWDGRLSVDSTAGLIYESTRYFMFLSLVEKHFDEDLIKQIRGASFNYNLIPQTEFYGYDTVTLLRLLNNEASWWVNEAGGKEAVLINALKKAVNHLNEKYGNNMDDWQWGKAHQVSFHHSLGVQPPMSRVFNQGPFPVGGNTDTLCQTATMAHDPQGTHVIAPSYRQIIDTGDWSRSLSCLPPGQSENKKSEHYSDQIEPWLKGEYHPMLWTRDQVEDHQKNKLLLQPG